MNKFKTSLAWCFVGFIGFWTVGLLLTLSCRVEANKQMQAEQQPEEPKKLIKILAQEKIGNNNVYILEYYDVVTQFRYKFILVNAVGNQNVQFSVSITEIH